MIDFVQKEIEERRSKKVNVVIVPKDDRPQFRPMCQICRVHMQWSIDHFVCLECGAEEGKQDDGDKLINQYQTVKPFVGSISTKKKPYSSPDFPQKAQIIEDIEYLGDGTSRELT
jgi:hypothetical protein